ncbi:hypothetical protein CWI42_070150 [Ordospora colligata]|uniref:Uncharacterized protein n=1 Tax=Ordospora colligata OC4 TaxID=1354746 RepID=A0A0B2UJM6_9MICR|nr:uncharacterized protein M896_070150 [Ordospora colligata OC4]KHN69449.1 hypothetical protein M896_070150 [Ordospora colligata OC4]TBU15193.1 hypothetical protein CWI41_070150 [Ordospora colligata]TBU15264.1 hypothetical protein CWI40_070150 [Ordospora colligata]TBU18446.1 hypothetical protein CWI42_070150 [Ordospora colligata]
MSKIYLKTWKDKREKEPNKNLSFKERLRIKQQIIAVRQAMQTKIKTLKTKKKTFLRERQRQREAKANEISKKA